MERLRARCQGLSVGLDDLDSEAALCGPALCLKILSGLDVQVKGFCRCSKLRPTKDGGYVQLSWGGANKFCVLEELLLWAGGVTKVQGDQCSHRCGEPLCCDPEHICRESARNNNIRKGCVVWWACPHGCQKKIVVCTHEPLCIKFVPGFASWEDFIQIGVHE